MKKLVYRVVFFLFAQIISLSPAVAGTDLVGHVKKFQVSPDGSLWFSLDAGGISNFCKSYWYDLSLYIKIDNPQYNYYYGMLMTAYAKGKPLMVANISVYDGTVSCDIGRTGYGLVLVE